MVSVVDQPFTVEPRFDPRSTLDSVPAPMALSTSLSNSFFDDAFFSKLSKAPSACSGDDFAPPDDYMLQSTLDPSVFSDESSDSARVDSLFADASSGKAYGLDNQADAKSQQWTPESDEDSEPDGKSTRPQKSAKRRRHEAANTPETRARREVNLEKNRMAANRCRQKKRDWTNKLEDKHRQLSTQNKFLRAEAAGLSDVLFELKDLALRHADCAFPPIDEYVRNEAERVRQKARGSI